MRSWASEIWKKMGLREKVRETEKEKGRKDGNSHIGHPLSEGPTLKSITFSIKETAEDDGFQFLFLPLLTKSYLYKELHTLYIVLHLSEISRRGEFKKSQTSPNP